MTLSPYWNLRQTTERAPRNRAMPLDSLQRMTKPHTAEWYCLRAYSARHKGHWRQSLRETKLAIDRFAADGDIDALSRMHFIAGSTNAEFSRLEQAAHEFRCAATIARDREDLTLAARCALRLGTIAHYRNDNVSALHFLGRSILLFERTGSQVRQVLARIRRADVLIEVGNLKDARVASERALTGSERMANLSLQSAALRCHAEQRAALGDLALAEAQGRYAAELAKVANDPLREAESFRALAGFARMKGDSDLWHPLVGHAIAMARDLGDMWTLGHAYLEKLAGARFLGSTHDINTARANGAAALAKAGAHARAQLLVSHSA